MLTQFVVHVCTSAAHATCNMCPSSTVQPPGRPGLEREREREVLYILCQASSLIDVPGYVNPDKLMNVPIGFVCR